MRRVISYLIMVICVLAAGVSHATLISDAAAAMKARAWRPVLTPGITEDLFKTGPVSDAIFAYTDDAKWDPVSKQILFLGCPHYAPWRFPVYKDSANTWRSEALPRSDMSLGGSVYIGHAYDDNAVDFDHGNFYNFNGHGDMYKFSASSNSWSQVSQGGTRPAFGWGMALEYFPELGGLLHVFAGTISLFNLTSLSWSTIRTSVTMGDYHNIAEYDPVHHIMLLGGGNGNNTLHKLDAQRNLTTLSAPPVPVGINASIVTVDPVTGRFLIMSGQAFYAFDAVADSWELLSADISKVAGLQTFTNVARAAASISTYGVVVFISNYIYPVLLYKYADAADVEDHSLRGNAETSLLRVSPNPAHGKVRISLEGLAGPVSSVRVYDLTGREVADLTGSLRRSGSADWDGSRLPGGLYLLKVKVNGKVLTNRFLLQR